jgi:hypothetical protein
MTLFHIKKKKEQRGRIVKTVNEIKKKKNEGMKVAYLPLKKNITYNGIKFVPTSELCIVPRYRSS